MIKTKFIAYIALLFFLSCKTEPNKQIDEGKIENGVYHSSEIGWTMEIPNGWKVTLKDSIANMGDRGLDAINETAGIDYDISKLKYLLTFQKGRFNMFQSTSEPFELEYDGEWEENNQAIKELLHETFTSKGIKVDTSSSVAKIDKLEFEVFHITVYGPDGKTLLHQEMYGRHINGYDFGVNLNYQNEEEKNEMMNAWKNSKFE